MCVSLRSLKTYFYDDWFPITGYTVFDLTLRPRYIMFTIVRIYMYTLRCMCLASEILRVLKTFFFFPLPYRYTIFNDYNRYSKTPTSGPVCANVEKYYSELFLYYYFYIFEGWLGPPRFVFALLILLILLHPCNDLLFINALKIHKSGNL